MDTVFHRPELARDLALRLLDPPPVSAVRSGLFLAAPRRTGKSTFLKADLMPALELAGAKVLYVDLWEDIARDPADAIVAAVGAALSRDEGAVERMFEGLGTIDTVAAAGFSVSVTRADGGSSGVTLARALAALADEADWVVCLIIDEAQHALTTEAGRQALFALKAARDALNIDKPKGLRIVATGSSRDKLSMLRNAKQQAFFGAPLTSFPPLDRKYVTWVIEQMGLQASLDVDDVNRWFERAGHRPEILAAALDAVVYELGADASTLAERLRSAMEREVGSSDDAQMRLVRALTPLQGAVLYELARERRRLHAVRGRHDDALRGDDPRDRSARVDASGQLERAVGVGRPHEARARVERRARRLRPRGRTAPRADALRRHDRFHRGSMTQDR